MGFGDGRLANFRLTDAIVAALVESQDGARITLMDDDRAVTLDARLWAEVADRGLGNCFWPPRGADLADRGGMGRRVFDEEDDEDQEQVIVRARARGDVVDICVRPGSDVDDNRFIKSVTVVGPQTVGAVRARGCGQLNGFFLHALGARELHTLDLSFCHRLDGETLLQSPVQTVNSLKLSGVALADDKLAALIRRWKPVSVELVYSRTMGPLTLDALWEVDAHLTCGGFSLSSFVAEHDRNPFRENSLSLCLTDVWLDLHMLSSFARLTSLSLDSCRISGDWSVLEQLDYRRLDIQDCGPLSESLLQSVSLMPRLEHLLLAGKGTHCMATPNPLVKQYERWGLPSG